MAKKNEGPVADNSTGKLKLKEKKSKQPNKDKAKEGVTKVNEKLKMKPEIIEESVVKVDLNKPIKPEENETKEDNADDSGVVASTEDADATEKQKEVQPEAEAQETPVLKEITEEEVTEVEVEATQEQVEEAVAEANATGKPLPENIQKLVNFMEETGGDLNDYVKLNQDYSKLDNQDLLYEYYKQTKPHLNNEEINFLMEDEFSFDEDADDDRDIRRKKLALKEQVANAKSHLDGQKSKYYNEIKSGSKLTDEQKKAINFYEKSRERAEYEKKANSTFLNKTNKFFNDKFKGFEYNVGEKNYRLGINDVDKVKNTQSDINNFIGKFLDENKQIKDEAGYHKSLYTAMNSDAVARHFYEQGKADALKESIASSRNINMDPRQELSNNLNQGDVKVRVLGESSSDFKYKIKNKNK